ncbi:MAG: hypothetical protein EOO01_06680, partial [Chitinophagaceae bacterium]
MKHILSCLFFSGLSILLLGGCNQPASEKTGSGGTEEMVKLLQTISRSNYNYQNDFSPQAKIEYFHASLRDVDNIRDSTGLQLLLVHALLEAGKENEAVEVGEKLIERLKLIGPNPPLVILKTLAISYMRLGERANCVGDHSAESCIFPIRGSGIQKYTTGSEKAIELYREIIRRDPGDTESRWLLNIAYMALGKYPAAIPPDLLIQDLGSDTSSLVKPFTDMTKHLQK